MGRMISRKKRPDKPVATGSPNRRLVIGGLAVTGLVTAAHAAAHRKSRPARQPDAALREKIKTVVVIYAENRSFNNLFADFPGLRYPLAAVSPERFRQRDRDGSVLPTLPPIWGGLVPTEQIIDGAHYQFEQTAITGLENAPFQLRTPAGEPLPYGLVTRDLAHLFYHNQMQINGGRNDSFVAWGDSGALVMGHYGETVAKLRLTRFARQFTLCDNFFMGAFGGSFLNHQYLVAAQPPFYPNADTSAASKLIAVLEGEAPDGTRLKVSAGSPVSALDGPPKFSANSITPDFWAVNTMFPAYPPTIRTEGSALMLPPQSHKTIGDLLTAKGIDWAWYAGAWQATIDNLAAPPVFPPKPNFQLHHQPLNYFASFAPGTAHRARCLRDGGLGSDAATNKFMADAAAGRLPAVSFYKPEGDLNMHAGYSDIEAGDRHITAVLETLQQSPQWPHMLVVITFDENGGWWDHVAPPKGDRWGPGTRIPAMLVSPHVKRGHVEHAVYDTGSILRFITRRFDLETLHGLALRNDAMLRNEGFVPGDLTEALTT